MKPLIVAFGGIQGKLAMPIFEFKNFLTENFEDFNFIFIRDLKQAWYTRGMDFKDLNITTKNINENIKTLNNIIGKQENSKVIFLGNSMGGFASILYGVLLNVDCILSFSPQTFINSKKRKKYNDTRWAKQINSIHSKISDHKYFDLMNLNKLNYTSSIKLFVGSQSKLDNIHADNIKELNNVHISVEKGGHSVIRGIKNNGKLYKIIKEAVCA